MAFKDFKYEADDGDVYVVRMDPALQAAISDNTEPDGAINKPFHLKTVGGKKNFGINPRSVTAYREFGAAPNNGRRYIEIPILDPGKLEGDTPIQKDDTFTYKTFTWTIATVNPETER